MLALFFFQPFTMESAEEDEEKIWDAIEATKASAEQGGQKLLDYLKKWEDFTSKNFSKFPIKMQGLVNRINRLAKGKVAVTAKWMKDLSSGAGKILKARRNAQAAVDLYENFKPNSEDPFQSINLMLQLTEYLDSKCQNEWKDWATNPVSSSMKFMVRSFVKYADTAIRSCRDGAQKAQKLIKDRGGRCFGSKGGKKISRDPKVIAWFELDNGETLCPTGLRAKSLEEVWAGAIENGSAWIWNNGTWIRLKADLGGVYDLLDMYFIAKGSKMPDNMLINWSNNLGRRFAVLKAGAKKAFNLLSFSGIKNRFCKEKILKLSGLESKKQSIREKVGNNLNEFTAKYIFGGETIRSAVNGLVSKLENTVIIEGYIKDENSKGIENASVSVDINGKIATATTNSYGRYEMIMDFKLEPGSRCNISVSHQSYPDKTIKSRIDTQCWDTGIITLSKENKKLIIKPVNPEIYIGDTQTFNIIEIKKNKEISIIKKISFTGTKKGTFTVGHLTAYTQITVKEKSKEKEPSLEDAIKEIKEEEPDPCKEDINNLLSKMEGLKQSVDDTYNKFISASNKFFQKFNTKLADPCKDGILAYCFSTARNCQAEMDGYIAALKDTSTELIMNIGICSASDKYSMSSVLSDVRNMGQKSGQIEQGLAAMQGKLGELLCDENEFIQLGDSVISRGDIDPDFLQDGGGMVEVPGDGTDNDANGLQDEIAQFTGANIVIMVFDSGSAADDVFSVSVSGYGNLGVSPKGGLRSFGLNLPKGSYTLNLTVISTIQGGGTFTVIVSQNGKTIAATTGSAPTGGGTSLNFTVTEEVK